MFYPVDSLRRGGRFYLCWVADSWPLRFATITHRQLWSQDIRVLCDDLIQVMSQESGFVSARFSLRLSSQLMRGLVRLYQRKTIVFLGELCMMNATVIKHTKKKWVQSELPRQARALPRVLVEGPADEERVEERIQNSGNVVTSVDQITLREFNIPEIQIPIDNFGEEQHLGDRTLEVARGGRPSADASGGPFTHSTLDPAHCTTIADLDFTLFNRSAAPEELLLLGDLSKDIPQLPDILIPDLPVPEPQITELPTEREEVKKSHDEQEEKLPEQDKEMELEEIEESEVDNRKRKRPRKLIIDKKTRLGTNFLKNRIENNALELRYEPPLAPLPPGESLLSRPCRASCASLAALFIKNLHTEHAHDDAEYEMMLASSGKRPRRTTLPKIVEEEDAMIPLEKHQAMAAQELTLELTAPIDMAMDVTLPRISEPMDISDMPTQVLDKHSLEQDARAKRRGNDDDEVEAKRYCRSGEISFKSSQRQQQEQMMEQEFRTSSENKENEMPITETPITSRRSEHKHKQSSLVGARRRMTDKVKDNVLPTTSEVVVPVGSQGEEFQVSQVLQEYGLADAKTISTLPKAGVQRQFSGEESETQLGSLDRTQVDLGESEKTTETQRFLKNEWGAQGVMLKVVKWVKRGGGPLSVRDLVARSSAPLVAPPTARRAAACCFAALLKLKQHRFVELKKDPDTLEIIDITLGPRIRHLVK